MYQEKLIEKYNPNNIFKTRKSETIESTPNTVEMVEYKESIIKKIVNKIRIIFLRK